MGNDDDLLGFMKTTTSTSPRAKDGDDFINDLLDLSNGNGTSHAVNNDDVKEQDDTKQKSSKKYTVIKKNKKERKKMQALKITANTVNTDDYVNPLSFDMDLEGPIDLDNEMPTIKPYNQDEIVYKETEDGKKNKSK